VTEQPARWTKATIYLDMWVDPDDDPRDRETVSPEGELPTLQDYLTKYRKTLLMKCEELDAEKLARRSVPPSTLSLLGLLRHLAEAERDWRNWISEGDPLPKLYGERDADFENAGGGCIFNSCGRTGRNRRRNRRASGLKRTPRDHWNCGSGANGAQN
jgi:hypothetical protein